MLSPDGLSGFGAGFGLGLGGFLSADSENMRDISNPESFATYEEGLEIAIEEALRELDRQHEGVNALNAKARSLLSATSMILALVGILQLILTADRSQAFRKIFGVAIFLYAVLVALSAMIQQPIKLKGPIKAEWDTISIAFAWPRRIEMLEQRLINTLNAIDHNEKPIARKRLAASFASWLLPAIVGLLLAASFTA